MKPLIHPDPFPHVVIDGWADESLVRCANEDWPGPSWTPWIHYATAEQTKRACPDWKAMPMACVRLLSQMALLPLQEWFGGHPVIPDTLLWGGGMHVMGQGGRLGVHLDHSHHPLTGLQRAYSAVLFVTPGWEEAWGGSLQLHGETSLAKAFAPTSNRLVVFRTNDVAFHSVETVMCPQGVERRSLAMFFHESPTEAVSRGKARFFG